MAVLDMRGAIVGATALAIKAPCAAATTGANITLSGVQTIDGIVVGNNNERVLVKDQANQTQNGIYQAGSGSWTLTTDFAGSPASVAQGTLVLVISGIVNAGLLFEQTCPDSPIVIGTSLIAFSALPNATAQIATSASTVAIATGPVTLSIPTGKNFLAGQWVLIQETSNSANQMLGQITAYGGGSLTVNVVATAGSGTHADWTIVLTNSPAAAGFQPPVGSGNVTGPGSSISGHVATFSGTTGKLIQDGGALGTLAAQSSVSASYLAASAISLGATMLNGTIVPSVSGGALTLAIKTLAGNNPSSTDPVWFAFRSGASTAGGGYAVIEFTAPLSITVPSGSSVGFSNATPGRLWLVAVNNGGVVSLAVINALAIGNSGASPGVYSLAGWVLVNVTAIGGAASNAQIFYGNNSLAGVPFAVLGHVTWEYGNTLPTAGAWSAGPSTVELYRPGVLLPGQAVQRIGTSAAPATGITATSFVTTGLAQSISLTSSANCVRAHAYGWAVVNNVNATFSLQRGTTQIGESVGAGIATAVNTQLGVIIGPILDYPIGNNTWSAGLTYTLFGKSSNGNGLTFEAGGIMLEEIMA
jgi:hypothetical protein